MAGLVETSSSLISGIGAEKLSGTEKFSING